MQESPSGGKTCAVVVTYHPDPAVLDELLVRTTSQVEGLVVVDNGSSPDLAAHLAGRGVTLLALGENLGIAAGFNRGIAWAEANGFSRVLLLDQDSIPASDMAESLAAALESLTARGERVAAVGPRYFDPQTGHSSAFARLGALRFRYVACSAAEAIVPADFLISSGSLLSLATVRQVGGMDEGLFIDLVDTEWYLRAASRGYRAFGVCAAVMHHSVGDHSLRIPDGRGGRHIPAHSPLRHYYVFRNSMLLNGRSYVPRRWVLNNWVQLFFMFVFFPLVTPPRLEHLRMMLRGMADGLRGMTGRLGG